MGLCKHATVEGVNAAAEAAGVFAWPDEKISGEVCRAVSNKLGGEEVLTNGLSPKTASAILGLLKEAHTELTTRGMRVDSALRGKTASERNLVEYAYERAAYCMQKVSEESGSLTNVGSNTPESAAATDSVAALDQKNRPTNEYLVGVGNSSMPDGGAIGKELPAPSQPGIGSSGTNSATEQSKVSEVFEAKGLSDDKLAQMIVHGATPQIRATALKLSNLKKTASVKNAHQKMADDIAQLLAALQASGIDPSQITEEELMMALQQLQGMGGGAGGMGGGMPPGMGGADMGGGGMPPGMMGGGDEGAAAAKKKDDDSDRKQAELLADLKKMAEGASGSLNDTGPNTPESAAKSNDVAALDQKNRPATEYVVEQGKSTMPDGGQIDAVHKPKDAPTTNPDTTASRETKTSALTPDEKAYVENVTKLAQQFGPNLPTTMPKTEKIAFLQGLLSIPPNMREARVRQLTASK